MKVGTGMIRKIIKYSLMGIGALILVWMLLVGSLVYYLGTSSGQQHVLHKIENVLKDSGYKVSLDGMSGSFPFDFTLETIKVNEGERPVVVVKNFKFSWSWKPLLHYLLKINHMQASSVEFFIPPAAGKEQEARNGGEKDSFSWPKLALPIGVNIDNIKLERLVVFEGRKVQARVQDVGGKVSLTRTGDFDVKVDGDIIKPQPLMVKAKAYGSLLGKKVTISIDVPKSQYAVGQIDTTIVGSKDKKVVADMKGTVQVTPMLDDFGLLTAMIGKMTFNYSASYMKSKDIKWTLQGGDGNFINLNTKGDYKSSKGAWGATFDMVTAGVNKLMKDISPNAIGNDLPKRIGKVSKVVGDQVEKVKEKISKQLPEGLKDLPDQINIQGAAEGALGNILGSLKLNMRGLKKQLGKGEMLDIPEVSADIRFKGDSGFQAGKLAANVDVKSVKAPFLNKDIGVKAMAHLRMTEGYKQIALRDFQVALSDSANESFVVHEGSGSFDLTTQDLRVQNRTQLTSLEPFKGIPVRGKVPVDVNMAASIQGQMAAPAVKVAAQGILADKKVQGGIEASFGPGFVDINKASFSAPFFL